MIERGTQDARIFFQLTRRHLLVFFRNKIRVMFTLLVPVVIFAVYLLFLRGLELGMVRNILSDPAFALGSAASDPALLKGVETLVDSWMLSGIIGLSTVTVGLQTNNVFVEDKQNGVNRDFASSPIRKNLLIASYFLYNFLVSALICLAFLAVCLVYLAATGEFVLSFADVLLILAVMFFATVASTLMTIFICSFVKTEGTMMSIVTIFSTAVGFLIGAYMPLGMLPVWVQGLCALLPGTYACALLRYAFLAAPLEQIAACLGSLGVAGTGEIWQALYGQFGYGIRFFGIEVGPAGQAIALSVFLVLFLVLNIGAGRKLGEVLGFKRTKKKK